MIRSFDTRLTSDIRFTKRSPDAQLLFFKLYFHPANHLCGLFHIEVEAMALAVRLPVPRVREALDELRQWDLVVTDEEYELVWIPEMTRANVRTCSAPNHPVGVAVLKHLAGLPPCSLVSRVADTLSLRYRPASSDPVPMGMGRGEAGAKGSPEPTPSTLPAEPCEAVPSSVGDDPPTAYVPETRSLPGPPTVPDRVSPPVWEGVSDRVSATVSDRTLLGSGSGSDSGSGLTPPKPPAEPWEAVPRSEAADRARRDLVGLRQRAGTNWGVPPGSGDLGLPADSERRLLLQWQQGGFSADDAGTLGDCIALGRDGPFGGISCVAKWLVKNLPEAVARSRAFQPADRRPRLASDARPHRSKRLDDASDFQQAFGPRRRSDGQNPA